jgi:nucleotide-binding universal stress UspA family protein
MTIRSVLVAYNGAPAADAALALAFDLASHDAAQVVGMLAHGAGRARLQLASWLTAELDRMVAKQEAEARAEIEARFWKAVPTAAKDRAAFLDVAADPDETILNYAHTYDVVAIGRADESFGPAHFAASPSVIALECGRPVLIAPPGPPVRPLSAGAVLAWDGKRASARAMADAMTVLPRGARVTVVSIGEDEARLRGPHRDPVEHLRRHGFDASFRLKPAARGGVAATLLGEVEALGAGLLVMGAYEHSKFGEDLVGGVTATILNGAPTPVLMAH